MVIMSTTGEQLTSSPITKADDRTTTFNRLNALITPKIPLFTTNSQQTTTVTPTTVPPTTTTVSAAAGKTDTTFDFLDDTVEIGDYKIKYKYIIGGVLLMVLLMKK